jgi:hypothetical protein
MEGTPTEQLSGDWIGYYCYGSSQARHTMELNLCFQGGSLSGRGIDDVGQFSISGTRSGGDCSWTKSYARHSVEYVGIIEENRIWGTWNIDGGGSGGFMLWPRKGNGLKSQGEATEEVVTQEQFPTLVVQPLRGRS